MKGFSWAGSLSGFIDLTKHHFPFLHFFLSSIHASDGPQKLLKVIKNPVSDHFPAGCRKLCSSFKAPRCVNAKELVPKPEVDGADTPIVIAVGAMAHGSLNLAYTEEDVAISGYPLSAALTCAKLCSAFEESWDVL